MASKPKNNNSLQAVVETILAGQGKTYVQWLNEKHMEVIGENAQAIAEAVQFASEINKPKEREEIIHG